MEEKILQTTPILLLLSRNDPASRETLLLFWLWSLFSDRVSLFIHFCRVFFIYALFDKIPFSRRGGMGFLMNVIISIVSRSRNGITFFFFFVLKRVFRFREDQVWKRFESENR